MAITEKEIGFLPTFFLTLGLKQTKKPTHPQKNLPVSKYDKSLNLFRNKIFGEEMKLLILLRYL